MTILWDVIEEEYNRLKELVPFYSQKIQDYPKGYLVEKKRGEKRYINLNFRLKTRIISKYVGLSNSPQAKVLSQKILDRKTYEAQLKTVKTRLKEIEGVLRKRKK